jgi:predicted MPP superfamily phosphohydrolase
MEFMKRIIYLLPALIFLLCSCGTHKGLPVDRLKSATIRSHTERVGGRYRQVSRVRHYAFAHPDVPPAFDGLRIAFVSDQHYQSRLKEEGLRDLTRLLIDQQPDLLLLGGDFHEGCEYIPAVIAAMAEVNPPSGIYSVLGNNDYEVCYDSIVREMKRHHIHLLEHRVDTLKRGDDRIILAGVRNPFDLQQNGASPTLPLSDHDLVILLTHTPDYAEDVPINNTDLVLAGHTHGGQATLFGLYAPVVPSRYGQRFLRGLRYNSAGIPLIITNGIGTSRMKFRLFAPSEIVIITLHSL